ncbi:MAG: tRNA preQ1(34) S-adenosylmethionine ribosyltransferase-isomerase QueA, partial [Desulfobulbaceae bacterium]|nr:tRNA preQ1(34) S-adenosylmethionine ribosyltransferase-isomerase QueA [Desulfobulbaceae bacterium]
QSGGRVELMLLGYPQAPSAATAPAGHASDWQEVTALGLIKSSKRPRQGGLLIFGPDLEGMVEEILADGKVLVRLRFRGNLAHQLDSHGRMPLPPYIRREEAETAVDRQRYQTVYAKATGAVAAPTAGLHFTPELLDALGNKGVGLASVTLHVGYGTFAPVRVVDIRDHQIHAEYLSVPAATAQRINATRAAGNKVWAVGTTTVRALEFAADEQGEVGEREGLCALYIYPGYRFRVVDRLITNFHLPQSSLLFMVSALAGHERIMRAYRHAIANGYRFYSYGDAMAIIT